MQLGKQTEKTLLRICKHSSMELLNQQCDAVEQDYIQFIPHIYNNVLLYNTISSGSWALLTSLLKKKKK